MLEGDRVPEAAPAPRPEELSAEDVADRFIRQLVVHLRGPPRADGPDHAPAGAPGANARGDARIRTRVDEDASRDEDPVGFLEGIDHALARNSSERPREDHHVERRVRQPKRLRGALAEFHVRYALTTGLGAPTRERAAIEVDREDRCGVASGAEREPAFARADVGHAKSVQIQAVGAELDRGRRTEIAETAGKDPPAASRSVHLRPEASHRCDWQRRRVAADP